MKGKKGFFKSLSLLRNGDVCSLSERQRRREDCSGTDTIDCWRRANRSTRLQHVEPERNTHLQKMWFKRFLCLIQSVNLNSAITQKQIIYAFIYKLRLTQEGLFAKLILENGNAYFPDNNICFLIISLVSLSLSLPFFLSLSHTHTHTHTFHYAEL